MLAVNLLAVFVPYNSQSFWFVFTLLMWMYRLCLPLVFARGGEYCGMSVWPLFLFNSVMMCSKRLDIHYRTPFWCQMEVKSSCSESHFKTTWKKWLLYLNRCIILWQKPIIYMFNSLREIMEKLEFKSLIVFYACEIRELLWCLHGWISGKWAGPSDGWTASWALL
jgi:hypothetical protein